MRPASEVLGDLWTLIERTEFGARAAPGGRERWAIHCARRAVSANVEQLDRERPVLREAFARAGTWIERRPSDDELTELDVALGRLLPGIQQRIAMTSRKRRVVALENAHRAVQTVQYCLASVAGRRHHVRVAEMARSAFEQPELEAAAQARRLLVLTKLLPSGPDLLVRLDYAESLGKLPSDADERGWIESQRALLMTDDEQARMTMLLRQLELVFAPELERLR